MGVVDLFEKVKKQYGKSMGGAEKMIKLVAKTNVCLRLVITTLQFWTPEATMSLYFT